MLRIRGEGEGEPCASRPRPVGPVRLEAHRPGALRSRSTAIGNKQRIRPVYGVRPMKTAFATIRGFEVLWAPRRGRTRAIALRGGIIGEAMNVERAFGAGPCALTGTIALVQDHLANAQP